jgi:hypothetical protein
MSTYLKHLYLFKYVRSFQKRSTLPPRGKFLPFGGETKLFLIIVNVLGHPKGVGGLTSNFLCGGGMDVFWNDPLNNYFIQLQNIGGGGEGVGCHYITTQVSLLCHSLNFIVGKLLLFIQLHRSTRLGGWQPPPPV